MSADGLLNAHSLVVEVCFDGGNAHSIAGARSSPNHELSLTMAHNSSPF